MFGEKFIKTLTHTHWLLIVEKCLGGNTAHNHNFEVASDLRAFRRRHNGFYAVFSYDVDWGFHLFDYIATYQGNKMECFHGILVFALEFAEIMNRRKYFHFFFFFALCFPPLSCILFSTFYFGGQKHTENRPQTKVQLTSCFYLSSQYLMPVRDFIFGRR